MMENEGYNGKALSSIFLQRYNPLHNFYFAGIWAQVPHDLMRLRPHPRTNSIAWNLWHVARVEDAGLSRFVADRPQVLDEAPWLERMNLPWRHHGTGMTFAEVDELSQRTHLTALHEYHLEVQARTRLILEALEGIDLEAAMGEGQLRQIMLNEGLAHSDAEGFIQNYLGWTKGKCLFSFGLTHTFQHLGEIEVLASLVGVDFG